MIQLSEFEGIAGYRWGALIAADGAVQFSDGSPAVDGRKMALIEQVLAHAPFQLGAADLVFELGKVLIRRGSFGCLILFCEAQVNVSMVDIIITEETGDGPASLTGADASAGHSLPGSSSITMLQPRSGGVRPIPAEVLENLWNLYTEFLGPLAKPLAHKTCGAAGIDPNHVATKDWPKLLNVLAARFDDDAKRDAFLDRAVLFKTQF